MKKVLAIILLLLTSLHAVSQPASFYNYNFIAPDKWRIQQGQDHIMLAQSQTSEPGCIIIVFPMQPSSGNLEQDAQNVFNLMYSGWQFRSAGEKRYDLSKGYTPQGLEYSMMEAAMSKLSADGSRYDGYEDGVALVIKSGNQIVIIASRHTTLLAHVDCLTKYETWRRFFNSFTVKNASIPKSIDEVSTKRIIGVWKMQSNGPASGEYIFAANGNYQLAGALGSSSTTSDYRYEYLYLTTYAFQGDGNYVIDGDRLTFRKRGNTNPEQVQFRFEKVNHGGTGWNDRVYLLKTDPTLRSLYEVCYEKRIAK